MLEDKASFLPSVLSNPRSTLTEISVALNRFHHLLADGTELSPATINGIHVGLIRRFLTDQLDFISIAKEYIQTDDFLDLIDRVIHSDASQGRLGGKSSGLFLANAILQREGSSDRPIGEVKVPRSWYVASEGLMSFIEYNDLDELINVKYKTREEIRDEYPLAIQKLERAIADARAAGLLGKSIFGRDFNFNVHLSRGGGGDAMMAGFYVYNNVGIAFRCFSTGALAGLGSVFYLVYNGVREEDDPETGHSIFVKMAYTFR